MSGVPIQFQGFQFFGFRKFVAKMFASITIKTRLIHLRQRWLWLSQAYNMVAMIMFFCITITSCSTENSAIYLLIFPMDPLIVSKARATFRKCYLANLPCVHAVIQKHFMFTTRLVYSQPPWLIHKLYQRDIDPHNEINGKYLLT